MATRRRTLQTQKHSDIDSSTATASLAPASSSISTPDRQMSDIDETPNNDASSNSYIAMSSEQGYN